jgi:predicted transcriptional regulator
MKDQELHDAKQALENATRDFRTHIDSLHANIKDRDKKVSKLQQRLEQKEVELKNTLSQLQSVKRKKEVEKKVLPRKVIEFQANLDKLVNKFKEFVENFEVENEDGRVESRVQKLGMISLAEIMKAEDESFPSGLETFQLAGDQFYGKQDDGTYIFPPQPQLIVEGDPTKAGMREQLRATLLFQGDVSEDVPCLCQYPFIANQSV